MQALYVSLIDLAIKSLAVMTISAAVASLPGLSAARRHLAWCTGVVALLALPILSSVMPAWQVHWLPSTLLEAAATEQQPAPVVVRKAVVTTVPHALLLENESLPVASCGPQAVDSMCEVGSLPVESVDCVASGSTGATSRAEAFPWKGWLVLTWLIGLVCALVPLCVGLWQVTRLRWRSVVVADLSWLSLLGALRALMGVRRPVELRRSRDPSMPLTWGAVRPVLSIPSDADGWPAAQRRMVLLHELAHIRRWDWLTQLVARVAVALYWFNPLVLLAAHRMSIERERACDDRVLAAGAKPSDYASLLLQMAAGWPMPAWSSLAAVSMARRSSLELRLRAILDSRLNRAAITRTSVALAMLLLMPVVPLAMLRGAVRAEEPAVTAQEKPVAVPADAPPPGDPSSAASLWVDVRTAPVGDEQPVVISFGETRMTTDPSLDLTTVSTKVWRRNPHGCAIVDTKVHTSTPPTPATPRIFGMLTIEHAGVIATSEPLPYSVEVRGEKELDSDNDRAMLAIYYAKRLLGNWTEYEGEVAQTDNLEYDLVPSIDGGILSFEFLHERLPVTGCEIVVIDPDGLSQTLRADTEGRVRIASAKSGTWSVTAKQTQSDRKGGAKNKTYALVHHQATLVLDLPAADEVAQQPPAVDGQQEQLKSGTKQGAAGSESMPQLVAAPQGASTPPATGTPLAEIPSGAAAPSNSRQVRTQTLDHAGKPVVGAGVPSATPAPE